MAETAEGLINGRWQGRFNLDDLDDLDNLEFFVTVDHKTTIDYDCDRVVFTDDTSIVLSGGKWQVDENY
jgi:hypothetical protein